jgi:DNA-binding transcriptional ArsR family regulator
MPAAIPGAMLESIATRFRAMGEPMRLRILQVLLSGDLGVTELAGRLDATQSNTSRHLKALHDAALVARRKVGLEVIYYIADPVVPELCRLMCDREEARAREVFASLPVRRKR